MIAFCSALGAVTVTLPLALLIMKYPVPLVEPAVGSNGIAVKYFSLAVKTDKSARPEQVPPVLHTSRLVDEEIADGKLPLLSI